MNNNQEIVNKLYDLNCEIRDYMSSSTLAERDADIKKIIRMQSYFVSTALNREILRLLRGFVWR